MEIQQAYDIGGFLSRCIKGGVPVFPFFVNVNHFDEYLYAAKVDIYLRKIELNLTFWIDIEGMIKSGLTPMPLLPIWFSELQMSLTHSVANKKELAFMIYYYLDVYIAQQNVCDDKNAVMRWQQAVWQTVIEQVKDQDFYEMAMACIASPINVHPANNSNISKLSQLL